jgi:hypothetical protein
MTCESVIGALPVPQGGRAESKATGPHLDFEATRAPDLCPLAGFFAHSGDTEVAGISLVHMAGQDSAKAGDLITFTAWILNATSEALTDVALHLRSFTNEQGDQLDYRTEPRPAELTGRTLGPRQSLRYYFSYEVTDRDVAEPGLLISALQAQLVTPSMGIVFSESDALVSVTVPGRSQHSLQRYRHQN